MSIDPAYDLASVERDWRAIEADSTPGFFTSWDWIGPLLVTLPEDRRPSILKVSTGSHAVAIGLLGRTLQRRHGFVRSRTIHLNEVGDPAFDSVTVEHNGLLATRGQESAALRVVLAYLGEARDWDELYLSGLTNCAWTALNDAAQGMALRLVSRWSKPYFYVDLNALRRDGKGYLDGLSSNTRYQARRALKGYAALGPLRIEHANSCTQALTWLDDLASLHQAQWVAKGYAGAFGSKFARRFHAAIVTQGWPLGRVQLVRALAGDTVLGYLYNFRHAGTIFNYQSGHVSAEDSKLKPGLVTHCLAVEDALAKGESMYDLLMGGEHFKRSLTTSTGVMHWGVLQQPRVSLWLEATLRSARRSWLARHARVTAGTVRGPASDDSSGTRE